MHWKYLLYVAIALVTLVPLAFRISDRNKEILTARQSDSGIILPFLPAVLISIPAMKGQELMQTVRALDFPVETLVLHDNSHDDASINCILRSLEEAVEDSRINYVKNLVVLKTKTKYSSSLGASLNQLLDFAFISMQLPWAMILQAGVVPAPGSLSTMATTAWQKQNSLITTIFPSLRNRPLHENAFNMFVVTKAGWGRLGLFDENYWPIPMDWCDYEARILAWKEEWLDVPSASFSLNSAYSIQKDYLFADCLSAHDAKLDPIKTVLENPAKRKELEKLNNEYFQRKWGRTCKETQGYDCPFNSIRYVLSYWTFDKERMQRIQSIVEN